MSAEDDFIARHFAPLAGPGGLGLRDDAALLGAPPGCDIVLTVDAVVAGVHFLADDAPGDIARKALRVNLSDLAAKGATPLGFLLTLALPRDVDDAFVAAFAAALGEDASDYGCPLLGGDTVSTPGPLTISITALGAVPVGRMVRRDGARAGDRLYVSGTVGDAALGLLVCTGDERLGDLPSDQRAFLAGRYRRPQPRGALAPALRDHASAGMDVSDGLAGDLTKMLALAGLSADIRARDIPLSAAAASAVARNAALRETVLTGGDDYEILCAVPAQEAGAFEKAAEGAGVAVRWIGTAQRLEGADGPVAFSDESGRAIPLGRLSYSHR